MALNKRKILDAAQKYLQKGNLDKALKEYEKVLEADPKDTNVRLKVGDVQLRRGNSGAAIEAYLEVASLFMKKGFDAKAVALFKQITKIDEKRYDIYEPLAELYQRLSLTSEAMQALQTAADAHQREGRKKEGLALLRKMAALDPTNTKTRMKIAEMLWKEDLREEALAEYDEVIGELGRQGDNESVVRVHEQVLRHQPERVENLIGLGLCYLELGNAEKADVPLMKASEVAVDSIEAWEGMARVHEALGRSKEFQDAWRTVAAIYRDRGNDDKAKEILQLYVPQGMTTEGEVDEETGDVTLGDLGAEPDPMEGIDVAGTAQAADDDDEGEDDDEIELDEEVAVSDDGTAAPVASDAPAEGDPSQLIAEAGVYLRYSQHDKAVQCLERILELEPGHLEALEKLGEARLAMGDREAALVLWKEGAEYARQGGNQEAFDVLCERVRDLDEGAAEGLAAEALGPQVEAEAEEEPEPEFVGGPAAAEPEPDDLDLEFDTELEFDTPSGEPELVGDVSSLDLEIDLLDSGAPEPEFAEHTSELHAPVGSEESSDLSARFEVRAGGVRIDGSDSGEVPAEDLEEAEFYFRQGLLDEAEQILKRLLGIAPGHPQVLLRLGEIAKSRGENPSTPVSPDVDFDRTEDETSPKVEPQLDAAPALEAAPAAVEHLADDASDQTEEDLDGLPSVGEPPAGRDDETVQVDPDDIDDVDFDDDEGGTTLDGDTVPSLHVDASDNDATEGDGVSGEGFDLAAELEDVFDDAPAAGPTAGDESIGGTTQAGFQSIFQSFKAGVKETLGEGEYDTHYDLGIAYREMGLLDDAMGEFMAALPSPTRKLDCLAMMGVCALDLGRAGDAVAHFEQALSMPDLGEDRMAGLRFDLGRAFAVRGDWSRTRELWEQVKAYDAEFQDVAKKLEELGDDSSPSLGVLQPAAGSDEGLENFDDLIAEAESDDDDDDDPDDGSDGSDEPAGGNATQWGGRKISYG